MSTTTTAAIDLGLLSSALGGASVICAGDPTQAGAVLTSKAGDVAITAALPAVYAAVTGGTSPATNLVTLQARATTALGNNETFLAIATPTQAQAVAQVQALTRQVNALIRLNLGLLSTITDS